MFKHKYVSLYNNKTKIDKKTTFFNNININYIYNLEFILKIPSLSDNKQKFIIMLILIDKYLNTKIKFLLDIRTISRSKTIKIGCIVNLTNEMLYLFFDMYRLHNIYEFYNDNNVIFEYQSKKQIRYSFNKIISNFIFNFDEDINNYYDYLNEFYYEITLLFKTVFNNSDYNRIYLSTSGIYLYSNLSFDLNYVEEQYKDDFLYIEEYDKENLIDNNDYSFNEMFLIPIFYEMNINKNAILCNTEILF